jgi:DNA-binding NarL/FixJ family response regulator
MSTPAIHLVSATRVEPGAFGKVTLLGRSLQQPQHRSLLAVIAHANRDPLTVAYNAAITTQLLEQGSGLDLVVAAKQKLPKLRTLLFLQHDHRTLLEHAVNTHSDGIMLEGEIGSGHVIEAMRTVSKGGFYLEPRIAHELHGSRKGQDPGLTSRELDVMQYEAYGFDDHEVGDRLHLATATIKYHLKRVYAKLGVHSRTRAAISLVVMGLVEPPRPLLPGA